MAKWFSHPWLLNGLKGQPLLSSFGGSMMSVWFLLVGPLTHESSQGAVFIYLDNLDSCCIYRLRQP